MAEKKIERTKRRTPIGTHVDEATYVRMKSLAALRRCKIGTLIDQACQEFLDRQKDAPK